jgi:hypothetical protein
MEFMHVLLQRPGRGIRMIDTPACGMLADGAVLSMPGIVCQAPVKLSGFKVHSELSVADIPYIDAVLGMDFLAPLYSFGELAESVHDGKKHKHQLI